MIFIRIIRTSRTIQGLHDLQYLHNLHNPDQDRFWSLTFKVMLIVDSSLPWRTAGWIEDVLEALQAEGLVQVLLFIAAAAGSSRCLQGRGRGVRRSSGSDPEPQTDKGFTLTTDEPTGSQ